MEPTDRGIDTAAALYQQWEYHPTELRRAIAEALAQAREEGREVGRESHGFILIGQGSFWWQCACTCGWWAALAYPAGHGAEHDAKTLREVYNYWQEHLHRDASEYDTDWRTEDFAQTVRKASVKAREALNGTIG